MPLNLEDFESRVVLRPLRPDDYDDLVALEKKCFPGIATWKREQVESQIARFPEGQMCIVLDDRMVASSSSLIVEFDDYDAWHSWQEVSAEHEV